MSGGGKNNADRFQFLKGTMGDGVNRNAGRVSFLLFLKFLWGRGIFLHVLFSATSRKRREKDICFGWLMFSFFSGVGDEGSGVVGGTYTLVGVLLWRVFF